jgi:ABC-type Fe3+ transport system substrate-binding protein
MSPQGELLVSQAQVYVDREMSPGDVLMRGEMDSLTPASPDGVVGAYEVKQMESLPDLNNKNTLYTALL